MSRAIASRSIVTAVALVAGVNQPSWGQATPVGLWRTISDVDGKPTGLVEIREVDGQLFGVVKAVLVEGESDPICEKCPDDRKGQRIVGMEVLRRMRPDGDGWGGGEILDPDVGKTYRASMHLEDGGKRLIVRGYIRFSLFGRSQTWFRVDSGPSPPVASPPAASRPPT